MHLDILKSVRMTDQHCVNLHTVRCNYFYTSKTPPYGLTQDCNAIKSALI